MSSGADVETASMSSGADVEGSMSSGADVEPGSSMSSGADVETVARGLASDHQVPVVVPSPR
jgi:hypothetical protein